MGFINKQDRKIGRLWNTVEDMDLVGDRRGNENVHITIYIT